MTIYLGLGSNEGDRRQNLENAIAALVEAGFQLKSVSPLVESPAMLPPQAESSWNKPYLNIAISGNADWSPHAGLQIAKQIEADLGRGSGPRWSPRSIDIDLLVWHDLQLDEDDLIIPHIGLAHRDFVISPLLSIASDLVIPGLSKTVFDLSLGRKNIPLWMGILNVTPDSFSDGDSWVDQDVLVAHIDKLIERDVQIIDIGAESTRPRADTVDDKSEWQRLQPALEVLRERIAGRKVRPLISVDSRHPGVIAKAIKYTLICVR